MAPTGTGSPYLTPTTTLRFVSPARRKHWCHPPEITNNTPHHHSDSEQPAWSFQKPPPTIAFPTLPKPACLEESNAVSCMHHTPAEHEPPSRHTTPLGRRQPHTPRSTTNRMKEHTPPTHTQHSAIQLSTTQHDVTEMDRLMAPAWKMATTPPRTPRPPRRPEGARSISTRTPHQHAAPH